MSLSTGLFSEKLLGFPKARGRQDVARGMFCRHKSGSAAINSFYLKSERRFHWITAGEKGMGGEWGT